MSVSLDSFAHSNPAFGLVCLRWVCSAYSQQRASQSHKDAGLLFIWGMVSLALLAPESTRQNLPLRSTAKLSLLLHQNPDWKLMLPQSLEDWAEPFWLAVRLGVLTKTLTFSHGRILSTGISKSPQMPHDRRLSQYATTFGKLLAKEKDDNAIALIFGIMVSS